MTVRPFEDSDKTAVDTKHNTSIFFPVGFLLFASDTVQLINRNTSEKFI